MISTRKKYNEPDCSVLLDSLVYSHGNPDQEEIDGCWMIAKPHKIVDARAIYLRIKGAVRVIRGKSFAVHYARDAFEKVKEGKNVNKVKIVNEEKGEC